MQGPTEVTGPLRDSEAVVVRTRALGLEGRDVIGKGKDLERIVVGGEDRVDFLGCEICRIFDGNFDRHQNPDKGNGQTELEDLCFDQMKQYAVW